MLMNSNYYLMIIRIIRVIIDLLINGDYYLIIKFCFCFFLFF